MTDNWGTLTRRTMFRSLAIALLLVSLPALIAVFQEQLLVLAAALGAIILVALTYRWPLPLLTVEMFLSTSALKFVGIKEWPHLIPGVPLDPPDLLVLLLFVLGVIKLVARREKPLFLGPLLILGIMAALSTLLGPLLHTQTLYEGLNGLRQLSGYFFCIAVVGLIDTPGRLRWLLRIIFAFAIISVGIQLLEAARGRQFTTALAPFNEYFAAQITVQVGDLEAAYLWNRAGSYLVVALFLALSQALWTHKPWSILVVALVLLGYVIQLIRQWYLFNSLGIVLSLLLLRKGRLRAVLAIASLALLLALPIALLTSVGSPSFPLMRLWTARVATLARFQDEPNYIIRVQTWQEQLRLFRQSPLFGHGPGSSDRLGQSGPFVFYDLDTGMSNTLLQYGVFGTAAIWLLIVAFIRQAYALYRNLPTSPARAYVAGLLALWIVMVLGYATSQDFFTAVELAFATGLAAALLDRFNAFAPRTQQKETE